MDLISLTPLAEYLDILYTRCATDLSPIAGLTWWIELHPPTEKGISGNVRIVGYTLDYPPVFVEADMHAIQIGAKVSVEVQAQVVDYRINRFKELLESDTNT